MQGFYLKTGGSKIVGIIQLLETYEMIPVVGYKTTYPRNTCIAVSYARLLLHDTSLRDHQYRLELEDTRLCKCGQGIEDDYHFFFECTRYTDIRINRLIQAV